MDENSIHRSMEIPSKASMAEELCTGLLATVKTFNYTEEEIFAIHLATEEAFVNAVNHGNEGDQEKKIKFDYEITPDKVEISITDQGTGFEPDAIPDPRKEENLYKTGGRGVLLLRAYMDVVEYNENGNSVRMIKYRKKR